MYIECNHTLFNLDINNFLKLEQHTQVNPFCCSKTTYEIEFYLKDASLDRPVFEITDIDTQERCDKYCDMIIQAVRKGADWVKLSLKD